MGNIRGMYDGIKKALGPTIKKVAPLKSKEGVTITDKSKQMERWVEHYLELYSKVSNVAKDAIDSLPQYPIMSMLDDEPDLLELSKALDAMANGKAPGSDGIPTEILKIGKETLLPILHTPSFVAGETVSYLKICTTPPSLPYTKTKVIVKTATITEGFHY